MIINNYIILKLDIKFSVLKNNWNNKIVRLLLNNSIILNNYFYKKHWEFLNS